MQFSEARLPWEPIPSWVRFLIRCGSAFAQGSAKRRIGIISMPCESAGAGLLALGALRFRLTLADANDALTHFERIQRLASKRDCGIYLRHKKNRGRFLLEGRDENGIVWVRQEKPSRGKDDTKAGPVRIAVLENKAGEWRLEHEPPIETVRGTELRHREIYEEIAADANSPLLINLTRSDSAICLAGHVSGQSTSREKFANVRFRRNECVVDLSELLTVHAWSPATVSRIAFYNSRIRQLDRDTGFTSLLVADGHAAFLQALEFPRFKDTDVVGVIHRNIDRDSLESIGTKLAGLAQWYAADQPALDCLQPIPTGITVAVINRR
ncbi:MAG: hypothetical protein HY749_15135 [Gammaproteobacteria bacterium]|nr:hypothetical protein [Gammaproteobacteria bacterium]